MTDWFVRNDIHNNEMYIKKAQISKLYATTLRLSYSWKAKSHNLTSFYFKQGRLNVHHSFAQLHLLLKVLAGKLNVRKLGALIKDELKNIQALKLHSYKYWKTRSIDKKHFTLGHWDDMKYMVFIKWTFYISILIFRVSCT